MVHGNMSELHPGENLGPRRVRCRVVVDKDISLVVVRVKQHECVPLCVTCILSGYRYQCSAIRCPGQEDRASSSTGRHHVREEGSPSLTAFSQGSKHDGAHPSYRCKLSAAIPFMEGLPMRRWPAHRCCTRPLGWQGGCACAPRSHICGSPSPYPAGAHCGARRPRDQGPGNRRVHRPRSQAPVVLPPALLPSDADALITSLPELEHLEVFLWFKDSMEWSPATGQRLRKLYVSSEQHH
jgi:hypothetical protein